MSKAVMISIQPYYVFLIIARKMGWDIPQEKTVEVRKNFPKDLDWNKVAHIYCSKNGKSFKRIPKEYQPLMEKFLGKVIGEFVCDKIETIGCHKYHNGVGFDYTYYTESLDTLTNETCLTAYDMQQYLGRAEDGECVGYGWHISDLIIYDKPKELGEFTSINIIRGYHKKNEPKITGLNKESIEVLNHSKRVEISKLTSPPRSWQYVEEV